MAGAAVAAPVRAAARLGAAPYTPGDDRRCRRAGAHSAYLYPDRQDLHADHGRGRPDRWRGEAAVDQPEGERGDRPAHPAGHPRARAGGAAHRRPRRLGRVGAGSDGPQPDRYLPRAQAQGRMARAGQGLADGRAAQGAGGFPRRRLQLYPADRDARFRDDRWRARRRGDQDLRPRSRHAQCLGAAGGRRGQADSRRRGRIYGEERGPAVLPHRDRSSRRRPARLQCRRGAACAAHPGRGPCAGRGAGGQPTHAAPFARRRARANVAGHVQRHQPDACRRPQRAADGGGEAGPR